MNEITLDAIDKWLAKNPDGAWKLRHDLVHRIFYDAAFPGAADTMNAADDLFATARHAVTCGLRGWGRERS